MSPESLNARRDALLAEVDLLLDRFDAVHPVELDGILGRARALLDAQRPRLERLRTLDLDAPADAEAQEGVIEALARLQHVPCMLLALGEVLKQQQKSGALAPVQQGALRLLGKLEELIRAWSARQGL